MTSAATLIDRSVWRSVPVMKSAIYGVDIRTNPKPIAERSLRELAAASEDVAAIAECVALADRLFTRRRSIQWARKLELIIPVYDLPTFQSDAIVGALTETLHFLTGDEWMVSFVARSCKRESFPYLPFERTPKSVIPFSDGLDSHALLELIRFERGVGYAEPVRVGLFQSDSHARQAQALRIPRRFSGAHPRERSYRSRPFVFFSIAAIACAAFKGEAVLIGENGQGSLGTTFAVFADEWPFRSTHPGFLRRLAKFLSLALNRPVEFEQPLLWQTKGEVLLKLMQRGVLGEWRNTRSCSQRPLQRRMREACGFCGGCLLRQVSTASAHLPIEPDRAFSCSAIDLIVEDRLGQQRLMTKNDRQVLSRAAFSISLFAEVEQAESKTGAIAGALPEIAGNGDRASAEVKLRRLIQSHKAEWNSFLMSLPDQAWLRKQFLTP